MEGFSDTDSGKVVAARVTIDGQDYAVVAVTLELIEDRIESARTMKYYASRLYGGLPVVLASRDALGRIRFGGGTVGERLSALGHPLEWKTMYEDPAA